MPSYGCRALVVEWQPQTQNSSWIVVGQMCRSLASLQTFGHGIWQVHTYTQATSGRWSWRSPSHSITPSRSISPSSPRPALAPSFQLQRDFSTPKGFANRWWVSNLEANHTDALRYKQCGDYEWSVQLPWIRIYQGYMTACVYQWMLRLP